MAGSGRGASASWLPVLMATCGVPETRRPSCLLQHRSFNWCQFCGPAVRSESPARESPAAPAWGSPGGRHWLVGGAAGNELVSNGSSLLHELASARGSAWLGLTAAASPVGDGAADGFLAPRLRAHATSLPLSSAGHGKSQGQLRVGKCGNKFHLLTGGAAKDFWPS